MGWLFFEVFCYVIWVAILISASYLTIHSRSYVSTTWMKKRNISVFYTLNISLIITIICFLMFSIYCVHYHKSILTLSIGISIWVLSLFGWMFALLIKNWMIYYNYKYSFYIQQSKWQQIVNPKIYITSQNWFIRNHQTYGQLNYIFKSFLLGMTTCAILCCLIWTITAVFVHQNMFLFLIIGCVCSMLLFIPWEGIYVFCVWNTPALDDAFQIHWESKTHAKLLGISLPIAPISSIYMGITGDIRSAFVACFFASLILFSMIIISTVLIPKKMEHQQKMHMHMKMILDNSNKVTLQMVLSNEITLNLFMNHLSTEYSMEILLFCIEIMQYQNYVKQHMETLTGDNITIIQFPKDIVMSAIVTTNYNAYEENKIDIENKNDEFTVDAKIKAHKLYAKYIDELAEFEINISGIMRDSLSEQVQDLNQLIENKSIGLKELYVLFENTKEEMITLQTISFERFRCQDQFQSVNSVFGVSICN
eukprot:527050_1